MNKQTQWLFEAPLVTSRVHLQELYEYVPSSVRQNFETAVKVKDWRKAFLNLNGLNMYEMLRALDTLHPDDLNDLWSKRSAFAKLINLPRIEYAKNVVVNRALPGSAPGDLNITGQVGDATNFLAEKPYNRHAAFAYARRFWNIPCSDNFIAGSFTTSRKPSRKVPFISVPSGTSFVHDFDSTGRSLRREHAKLPDGTTIGWTNLDDCTHFISCCIGTPPSIQAGGLAITSEFSGPPKGPYGIIAVERMLSFLRKQNFVNVIGDKSEDINLIKQLQWGDLIAYFHPNFGRHTHLVMYLGKGKVACHTYCRSDLPACKWDNDWNVVGGFTTWTFLHIK